MSTAPTGYQTPKSNWQSADVVLPDDLNRIEGNINAIELGNRTLDPAQAPTGNVGTLRQFLDWLANRIRAITGTTNWYDTPPISLVGTSGKFDGTTGHKHSGAAGDAPPIPWANISGKPSTFPPSAHRSSHATGGADALTPGDIGALPASSYTSDDVLSKLKTVDGAGSGLDSDTVDGSHASAFATASHTHAGMATIASGSYTGDDSSSRTIIIGFRPKLVIVTTADKYMFGVGVYGPNVAGIGCPASSAYSGNIQIQTDVAARPDITTNGFIVGAYTGYSDLNELSRTYYWIAIG